MPRKKRVFTAEERAAIGQRLKAAKAAKKAEEDAYKNQNPEIETISPEAASRMSITDNTAVRALEDVNERLVSKLDELEARLSAYESKDKQRQADQVQDKVKGLSVDEHGGLAGIYNKYPLSKSYYPDPTEQLQNEPFLTRFAFKENYVLKWNVDGMVYETKWGTTVAEPKFTVVLYQKMFDDKGEVMPEKLIRLSGLNIFEDPASVRQLVVELDQDTDGLSEKEIFDLVRYHRIKEWLKNVFQPAPLLSNLNRNSETVIDGRVVVIEEQSSLA